MPITSIVRHRLFLAVMAVTVLVPTFSPLAAQPTTDTDQPGQTLVEQPASEVPIETGQPDVDPLDAVRPVLANLTDQIDATAVADVQTQQLSQQVTELTAVVVDLAAQVEILAAAQSRWGEIMRTAAVDAYVFGTSPAGLGAATTASSPTGADTGGDAWPLYVEVSQQYWGDELAKTTAIWSEVSARHDQLVVELDQAGKDLEAAAGELEIRQRTVTDSQRNFVALATSADQPVQSIDLPALHLTILGPPVATTDQVVWWYSASGYENNTGISTQELVDIYWQEGIAEGVRPDMAFVQSVIETGGFSYMSAPNNFAGIGHCDSCDAGFGYPDVRTGVRAQMQYLRAYATVGFSPSMLANPAVPTQLGSLGVAGCCATWYSLAGVWATAVHYGSTLLRAHASIVNPPG